MKIVFVKRPRLEKPEPTIADALRATVKNGKAVRTRPGAASGDTWRALRRDGLVLHQVRRGKFILAWCENGARAKKGGR